MAQNDEATYQVQCVGEGSPVELSLELSPPMQEVIKIPCYPSTTNIMTYTHVGIAKTDNLKMTLAVQ